jgi:predicted methyltransferase
MMKRKNLLLLGLVCAAAVFAGQVRGDAADEVARLAALMEWKPGTIAADIGAGDGEYTFAAVERVGASGKVYATEIDAKKIAELKGEVAKRKLGNVIVVESKEADTSLPTGCCNAIFLRRVYHHLTKPADLGSWTNFPFVPSNPSLPRLENPHWSLYAVGSHTHTQGE